MCGPIKEKESNQTRNCMYINSGEYSTSVVHMDTLVDIIKRGGSKGYAYYKNTDTLLKNAYRIKLQAIINILL